MSYEPKKPIIIATIPHYDDRINIKRCYNKELMNLCDTVIILYGRVEKYPVIPESQEENEIKYIQKMLECHKASGYLLQQKNTFKDKRQMIQVLYQEALNIADQFTKDETFNTEAPIWILRIDSDEEMTEELREELEILTKLDYLYTIFIKERHFIDKHHIIIGSGGWDIKGNKFIPRLFKIYDGKDKITPIVPFHHSTTYANINKLGTVIPYGSLANITTEEHLHHWGHAKKKKSMKRKGKFYRNRGDLKDLGKDNYIPTSHEYEPRLRTWMMHHDFEGIMLYERGRKI